MVKNDFSKLWYLSPIVTFFLSLFLIFWVGLLLSVGFWLFLRRKNRKKAMVVGILNIVGWLASLLVPMLLISVLTGLGEDVAFMI